MVETFEPRTVRALVASGIFGVAGVAFDIVYLTFIPGFVTAAVVITGFLSWYVAIDTSEQVTVRQGAIVGAFVGFGSHFTHGVLHVVWGVLTRISIFVEANTEAGSEGVALTELLDIGGAVNQGLFFTIMGLVFAGVVSVPLSAILGAGTAWLQDRWL